MEEMGENPDSKDKSLEALDFLVNVLKEHERDLDILINELATVTEQLGETGEISSKVEKIEEKINSLQKEVTNLIGSLPNAPKKALSASVKEQAPQVQTAPAVSPAVVQGEPFLILRCKQWSDFQALAIQAQMLSFSYKEDKKVFHASALKGDQVIMYTGALPNFSMILKTWLSRQLDTTEQNILEGFLDKPE
jgi:seryl-tRNA synthetase